MFVTKSPALWSLVATEIIHFLSDKMALSKLTIKGVREVLPLQNAIRIMGNNGAGDNGVLSLFVSHFKSARKCKQTHFQASPGEVKCVLG